MEDPRIALALLPFLSLFLLASTPLRSHGRLLPIVDYSGNTPHRIETYVVHVVRPEGTDFLGDEELENWHKSFLPTTLLDSGEPRLIYSYRDVMSGFAARLTREEVKAMESKEGFLMAMPDQHLQLQTTYTPQLLNLNTPMNGAWQSSMHGAGVIIAILDTGIIPTHPSFDDAGMSPPDPVKWKGKTCLFGKNACNNKLIGADSFNAGTKSVPTDTDGHGTHVAGTAAGNFVRGASVLGTAHGTAAGMAPKAHLAIYKVCYPAPVNCPQSETFAAIDQAIKDGVDIISMSIGGNASDPFYYDGVVRGSLAAARLGIAACAAAGNYGPKANTLAHDAPWVLTVGASTTDRKIRAVVKLGNGREFVGESAFQPSANDFDSSTMLPIFYDGAAYWCGNGTLDQFDVKGKLVLCYMGGNTEVEKGQVVYDAGGAAMVIFNVPDYGYTTLSNAHVLPASQVGNKDGLEILNYFFNTGTSGGTPTATIVFEGTRFNQRPAPTLAPFSSRGPSPKNGEILKPDILAPGVGILAAWPFKVGPNPTGFATKTFNFLLGTSMATPHVAGIMALIKNKHPSWPPSYIQSAIITSGKEVDMDGNFMIDGHTNKTAGIFGVGAGQVNPLGALDPGLVYDVKPGDYIRYLCGLGYTDDEVTMAAGSSTRISCSSYKSLKPSELNYPSISAALGSSASSSTATFPRTVTNVGEANAEYTARVVEPAGVRVDLSQYRLRFSRVDQVISFSVTLTARSGKRPLSKISGGKLEWVSGNRVVKTPIAVRFV